MRVRRPGPVRGAAALGAAVASIVGLAGCAEAGPPSPDATSIELAPGDYWAYDSHWLIGEPGLRQRAQWADGGATLRVATMNGPYCPTVPVRLELVDEHVLRLDFDLLDPSARDQVCPLVGAEYSFDVPVPERLRGADAVRWDAGTPVEEDGPILAEDVVPEGAGIDPADVVVSEGPIDPAADRAGAGAVAWSDDGGRVSFRMPFAAPVEPACPRAPVASHRDDSGTTHVVLALAIPREQADCGGPRADWPAEPDAGVVPEPRYATYDVPVALRPDGAGAGNGRLVVHDAMFGAIELPIGG